MRGARVADRGGEIVDERFLRGAEASGDTAYRARVHAGDDDAVHLAGRKLGRLQCRVPRLVDQRRVLDLAETFFPLARARRPRRTPTFDEFFGRARGAEEFGNDGAVGVVAHENRRAAVTGC